MEKIKIPKVELIYHKAEDLKQVAESESIRNQLLRTGYKPLEHAIKNKLKKVEIFDIYNLGLKIEVERDNYKPILENLIKLYAEDEDFDKCTEIQNLIKHI